jgi:hypothetical protein
MEAKGMFFVGRRQYIVSRFGEARWDAFIAQMAKLDPVFARPILATTRVPIASYLRFNEECLRSIFAGDPQSYWIIGEESGAWALTAGPYKHYRENRTEFRTFIERSLPQIWSNYFTAGELKTSVEGTSVHAEIVGLPVWHLSFEYSVMGFLRRAIQLAGFPVQSQVRVRGVSAGHAAIEYRFLMAPTEEPRSRP